MISTATKPVVVQVFRHHTPLADRQTLRSLVTTLRALAVAALIAVFTLAGATTSRAVTGANTGGANRFGACLASAKTGDLLLLFDESSSLQQTDPAAARVAAAKPLLETLGRYADRVKANLDVAVAGFSDSYYPEQDWTQLTEASADGTAARLSPIASKNTGIDTDYWLALDGARQALAARGSADNGAKRCQAVAWFSDGMIDFTARPGSKPYADGVPLDSPNGIDETRKRAIDSICRPGGLADQVRSSNIVMLGIGLGADKSPGDFDVMSSIATGHGLAGMTCGQITDPAPGDFYPVANIDDMLFAFDSLNPDPGVNNQGPVCQLQVCPEARHNFVLDRSIKSVNILGSGGVPGVVPYLVAPSGQQLELPKKDGKVNVDIGGIPVTYEWQSESAQTVAITNNGTPQWSGQWAIVYVDTTGQHPDAVSRVNIHITTDLFPALVGADKVAWHSGQVLDGLAFGLVDGAGKPVAPADLAGSAVLSATLVPDGATPIPLLDKVSKADIANRVKADLTTVKPGHAVLKMSLVVTTAPATNPTGAEIAPGTELSPQDVEVPLQILPKLGLPTPGDHIDFGTVQAAKGANATLNITGPGCAWIADADATKVAAVPDGIGAARVTSPANSAQNCLKVAAGQTGQLSVTLRTDHDGHGGLNGTAPVHVATVDNPNDSQVVDVPFNASLIKPLNTTNFVLVLIAALLLGPGIPLALLYASKWWVSKIPGTPLLAERIGVEVRGDEVLRDGEPFAMADKDLIQPVVGLTGGGVRKLDVLGVQLTATMGRSPFGAGHVTVHADGRIGVGSVLPGTDKTGLTAVLPLAVHNKWVVLHDPHGPASAAEVLLLVSGNTDTAARERIYEQVAARLPDLLGSLRLRAAQAGMATHGDGATAASPFGDTATEVSAGTGGYDPFAAGPVGAAPSYSGHGSAPDYRPAAPPPSPRHAGPPPTQPPQRQTPPGRPPQSGRAGRAPQASPPGSPAGGPPGQYDPDPFDPFGEGS